jgi:two-component system, NarL family, nitrate/nitrite response regulator NarL
LVYFHGVAASDKALRVILADDHHFYRQGLRRMLEADGMTIVGEAADGAKAVTLARELSPDVVVIDLKMPNTSGIAAIHQLLETSPGAQLVAVTVSAEEDDAIEALAAGACSYLLKDTRADDLVSSIRLAASGHAVLSREAVRALVARVRTDSRAQERALSGGLQLTARELDVIRLIVDGADNSAIGRELSLSPHTVKQHVTNIFEKLGVSSRVQAAVYAVRNGLV